MATIGSILTKEVLEQELRVLSPQEVADKYNCSRPTICVLKKKYGFEVREMNMGPRKRKRDKPLILFLDCDLYFEPEQIDLAIKLWKAGKSIKEITKRMERTQLEMKALYLQLLESKEIKPMKNGVFGEV